MSFAVDPHDLLGTWTIERDAIDRLARERGRLVGTLDVRPSAAGHLDWHEDGQLEWAGRTLQAQRSLRLAVVDDDWWVTFTDGRLFHPWVIGEPVVHPCAADTYRGLIVVDEGEVVDGRPRSGPRLTITWEVNGPAKNYTLVSRLSRLS